MITLQVNEQQRELEIDPEMPLLWAIRDVIGLTGTKYGCGKALCGACTVHIDGQPMRSCSMPVGSVGGRSITTIEGLKTAGGEAVRSAWNELQVPQCGFCQSGQIMSASALLDRNPYPDDRDIDLAMQGNICRCSTYIRIRKAVKSAASRLAESGATDE